MGLISSVRDWEFRSQFELAGLTRILSSAVLFLAFALVSVLLGSEVDRIRNRIPNLPGPRGYPIFGSLLSLKNKTNSEEYRRWVPKYGDVFQVQLGNTTAVVVNTAAAARALLIAQREATNSRPEFYVLHKKVQQGNAVTSIGTSAWDHSCKRRRKIAATALNKTSVESYHPILDLESRSFLRDVLSASSDGAVPVDVLDLCRKLALNLSLTLSYGTRVEDVKDLHDDLLLSEIIYIEEQITKFRDVSANYLNYIPLLRPIATVASWLGLRTNERMADVGKRRYAYHAALQQNLRRQIELGTDKPCIQGNVLKDTESKGLTEGELLSISLSMMAGSDTTKRSLLWAMQLLAHRQDIQAKAYRAIASTGPELLEARDVAHTKIEYIEALVKEVGRYFVVLRLALPKATHSTVKWQGAKIPPKTLLFLNTWACAHDPAVFPDEDTFSPERWLDEDQTANRHQFAFGMGGRMCVASHVASKALYTVLLHLIAHFEVYPLDDAIDDARAWDPLAGLANVENPQAAPLAQMVRFVPRTAERTRAMLLSD